MNMKKAVVVVSSVLAGFGLGASAVMAAEASVSLDVASAYVFRGVTFNDGLVAQPGMEISGLPVTLGVWGNFDIDDYDGTLSDGQFSEIDLYASYTLPLNIEKTEVSVGYTEYLYMGSSDADRELAVTVGFDYPLSPEMSVYYGIDGAVDSSLYIEAGLSHELAVNEKLSVNCGATIGYAEPDEGDGGFSNYTASLGASYSIFYASVTYVGQIDDDVLPDVSEEAAGYDTEVYGVVGIGYDF